MRKIFTSLVLLTLAGLARGQEINFSRVQDMTIWYNQSLKTDKQNSLDLNYRSVTFGGQIAYNSVAALFSMPLVSKETREKPNTGYLSLSAGAASDRTNDGILNNDLGTIGLSYAVPVGRHETYLAVGFQAQYYQSNFNVAGVTGAFGDQFNNYGPIEGQPSADRLASGWSYGHFNLNAGASIFSNGRTDKWYLGGSVMQVNQPYAYKIKSDSTRLKPIIGIQGGYRFTTKEDDEIGFYMAMNWEGPAYRHYYELIYTKPIPGVAGGAAVGVGLGYRYDDALVPNIELRYQKLTLGVLYDVNISTISASGIARDGLEMSIKMDF